MTQRNIGAVSYPSLTRNFFQERLKQEVFDVNPKANNPPKFSVIYFYVITK